MVVSVILLFFSFHIGVHLACFGVHLACFGPSLNKLLEQKDVPTPIRHRVQFIASKTSIRWSYDRNSDSAFFAFFGHFHINLPVKLVEKERRG